MGKSPQQTTVEAENITGQLDKKVFNEIKTTFDKRLDELREEYINNLEVQCGGVGRIDPTELTTVYQVFEFIKNKG